MDIYKSSYTGALLCLDAGGEGDTTGTLNPRGIGKPLIKLGKRAWSNFGGGFGDYYGIGFGYSPLLTDFNCVEIGTLVTNTSGAETGDFVVSTRPTVTNVVATERMRITSGGNVGIGTATPGSSRLMINHSSTSMTPDTGNGVGLYIFNPTNSAGNNSTLTLRIAGSAANKIVINLDVSGVHGGSIYMQSNQWRIKFNSYWDTSGTDMAYFEHSTNQFWCYGPNNLSDRRIKRDIEDINDDDALNKILLIQPTTYYYRDESRNRGNGKVYGFIAQQIKEVIPDAVRTTSDIIANIYKICLISNKRNVYHSIPLDVPIDTEIRILENENGKGAIYKIKEIYEDYFVIDNDIDTDEAFVYGYNVNDLNGLDKSYIFTLNVCATQELHRRIEAQSVVIKSYEDRIKDLETKVAMLMSSNTT